MFPSVICSTKNQKKNDENKERDKTSGDTHVTHRDASAYATDTLTPCFNVAESNSELSNHRSKPTELATEIYRHQPVGHFPKKTFLLRPRNDSWTPIRHGHQLSLHLYKTKTKQHLTHLKWPASPQPGVWNTTRQRIMGARSGPSKTRPENGPDSWPH